MTTYQVSVCFIAVDCFFRSRVDNRRRKQLNPKPIVKITPADDAGGKPGCSLFVIVPFVSVKSIVLNFLVFQKSRHLRVVCLKQ